MKKSLSILVCLLMFYFAQAQVLQEFSKDTIGFFDDLTEHLTSGNKTEGEQLIVEFMSTWQDIYYTDQQKEQIKLMCDKFLRRKAPSNPHFLYYITILVQFPQSNYDNSSYVSWNKALDALISDDNNSLSDLSQFLRSTIAIVKNNNLFESQSIQWNISETTVSFEYDSTLIVKVGQTNLTCRAMRDSIIIYDTHGVYFPLTSQWLGQDGIANWERLDINRDIINAKLTNYKIDLTKTYFSADTVLFTNINFSKEPLLGKLEEKVIHSKTPQNYPYPKFDSFDKKIEIKNIYPGINYLGGYSMHGDKFIGTGDKKNKANLCIIKGDTILMNAWSTEYIFGGNQIKSNDTEISIYLGKDSIYHPNLLFKYFTQNKHITLIRNIRDKSQMRYFNSYHKLTIDAEMLVFPTDSLRMFFTNLPGSARHKANLRSYDFFTLREFQKLQLMDEINPIAAVRKYQNKFKTDEFYAVELAKYLRRQVLHVHQMLIKLYYEGFIEYDIDNQYAKIKPKVEHYIKARKALLSERNDYDYDIIEIIADTSLATPTAILDLRTYNMQVFGVDSFLVTEKKVERRQNIWGEMSERKPVSIKPQGKTIILKENRDFEFDGKLTLGNFTFHGQDFHFDYDSLKIDLKNVDSLKVILPELDNDGKEVMVDVKNKIEEIVGYVYLDEYDNKAGNRLTPGYPKFTSSNTSYVYYGDSTIQEIAYEKDKFKFAVDPYKLDSLYDYTTNDWVLKGTFESGGIINPLKEELRIMKDTVSKFNNNEVAAFGFHHEIDSLNGMGVFGDRGKLYNTIKLGLPGLRGNGYLEYLTSKTVSEDFKFYQDSMGTDASEYTIARQTAPAEYPNVENKYVHVHWEALKDRMFIYSGETPFLMYKEENYLPSQITMAGKLTYTPEDLQGDGLMKFERALLSSEIFKYANTHFDADTSDYTLLALQDSISVFSVTNIKSNIDLTGRKGIFSANTPGDFATFPANQYIAYMQEYKWLMDDRKINLFSTAKNDFSQVDTTGLTEIQKEDLTLEGSKMVSIEPSQDSINFYTTYAEYDIEQKLITADPVKLIRIADATIYPSTPVVIEEHAKIRTLNDSRIIASNENRLHTISNAVVDIYTRQDYAGSGTYQYMNETGVPQSIRFESIFVQDDRTMASGDIKEDAGFMLSPFFKFEGEAHLDAGYKFLMFEGATEMVHSCDIDTEKFRFEARINPNDVYIPVKDSVVGLNQEKLFTALFITQRKPEIYSSFLTKRKFYSDIPVLNAGGYLYHDSKLQQYKIGEKQKIKKGDIPGKLISLETGKCIIHGEGKLKLGVDLGQVKTEMAGYITHELIPGKINFDVILGIDFFFSKSSIDILKKTFEQSTSLAGIKLDHPKLVYKLKETIGNKETNRIYKSLSKDGSYKIPKELEHTLTFSNLKLTWNPDTRSYRSNGKLGLLAIEDLPINKFVEGFIEIIKKRTGDMINIYFKLDKKTWFFFTYTNEQMLSVSSVQEYNDKIVEVKEKNRKMKTTRREAAYEYNIAEQSLKNRFLRRFLDEDELQDYDSKESEYSFGDPEDEEPEENQDTENDKPKEENNDEMEGTSDDKENKDDKNNNQDLFDDDDDG